MAPTRWGIASTGKISFDFTNALSMLPPENHQVVAVAARALTSAQTFAKEFNISKAYGSYKELADDPDIDVVYIGTIHPTHFDLSKMMIEAGKNILCEKPMTMNLKQTQLILSLAKEKNVFFMEGFWSRFFPIYQRIRDEIKGGNIGDVKMVHAHFGVSMLEKDRMAKKELGGGSTLDVGCYTVQFALMVFGEMPKKIVASGLMHNDVDEAGCVTLHFSGNRVAQLNYHAGVDLDNNAHVYGSKGMLKVPFCWSPVKLVTPEKTYEEPLPTPTKPMNHFHSEGFIYEADAVRDSLLKGQKEHPLMTHQDSINIITILDEARRQIGMVYDVDSQ